MQYWCSYSEIVDGKTVSTGETIIDWETKIRTLKDFNDFVKTVHKTVGKEVEVSPPCLLD